MKKMILLFLVMMCVLCSVGCSGDSSEPQGNQGEMYIMPSQFSEETMEVLEVLDHELQFFDISINDTAKSHTVSVWVYRDGEWHEDGKTYGETKFLGERLGIKLTSTSCELISMDENGHTRMDYPVLDTSFDETTSSVEWRLRDKRTIELNKEIPLWVIAGSEDGYFQFYTSEENFRQAECDAGVAVTITLSDEEVR